jgi:hypothetical protein
MGDVEGYGGALLPLAWDCDTPEEAMLACEKDDLRTLLGRRESGRTTMEREGWAQVWRWRGPTTGRVYRVRPTGETWMGEVECYGGALQIARDCDMPEEAMVACEEHDREGGAGLRDRLRALRGRRDEA